MTYTGGKNRSWRRIVNEMPPHTNYVEAFAGSAAVYRYKRRAEKNTLIELDPLVADNLRREFQSEKNVQIVNRCALEVLRQPAAGPRLILPPGTLIYCDPPYLRSVRSQKTLYSHEFAEDWLHSELLCALLNLNGLIMVSGYRSELYDRLLSGWRRVDYVTGTRQGGVMESLWCNFPEPFELHDARFIGDDRTQRQAFKRKVERWRRRLAAMPPTQRRALHAALSVNS